MDLETRYIFIDTSVYEKNNFQFHEFSLGNIKQLCKEEVLYLLHSPIVTNEVKKHLEVKSSEAIKYLKDFKKNAKILRNLKELNHHAIFETLEDTTVRNALLEKFDLFLNEATHKEVSVADVSIEKIIDSYFNEKAPFSSKKKSEFPDAFILESLLSWAKRNRKEIYIISNDGDMKNFCEENKTWLIYENDIDKFLNMVNSCEEKLADLYKFAISVFSKHTEDVTSSIEEEIESIEYTSIGYDIDDEVEMLNVSNLKVLDMNIINVDREFAELSLSIKYNIEAMHNLTDYSRSIWDSEDKRYIFTAKCSRRVEQEVKTTVYLELHYEDGLEINSMVGDLWIDSTLIELDPDEGDELEYIEHSLFDDED